LHVAKKIDIFNVVASLSKKRKAGRPPNREAALQKMKQVDMNDVPPERWRFQDIIREKG
jgi:hypothetical protein